MTSSDSFAQFQALVSSRTNPSDYPLASCVQENICCYDMSSLSCSTEDGSSCERLMQEWYRVLVEGPGVFVIQNSFPDIKVIDRATEIFSAIIAEERANQENKEYHFGKKEDNDRIWNSLEKHCLKDPTNFAKYYENSALCLACRSWLGVHYQVTSQVNTVKPGGAAQRPHRDYHLGFVPPSLLCHFPPHVHALSPMLTLQGAVAHSDMPLHTGPTKFLPHSQKVLQGYTLFTLPHYQNYFEENFVQVRLHKGDIVFFNPAVMHGAGSNSFDSGINRMANLLQISSAFGRAMESVNRTAMIKCLYPVLLEEYKISKQSHHDGEKNNHLGILDCTALPPYPLANVIASSAEGYAFPSNLDKIPPAFNFNHESQASILTMALLEEKSQVEFINEIDLFNCNHI